MEKSEHKLKYYKEIAAEMIAVDRPRNEFFQKIDKIDKVEWELPPELLNLGWVKTYKTSDGCDAIRTATRVISGMKPRIKFRPMADNDLSKKDANMMERALDILLNQASKRNHIRIERDVAKLAVKYDMVCAQVIDIDYQKKISKQYKLGGGNWDYRSSKGRFAVKFRDPRTVHTRYSDYGQEAILYVYKQKLQQIVDFWGKDKFADLIGDAKPVNMYMEYTVCDYTDSVNRCVWVEGGKEDIEILNCLHNMPFIPWVAIGGGTNVEDESKYMYEPLLKSQVLSDSWEIQNIVESLGITDVIVHASMPKGIKSGTDPDRVEVDYSQPGGDILAPTGTDYKPIPPAPMDQAKLAIADRISNNNSRSSIPRILQDAQMPSNVAFSAINTVMSTASSNLRPHLELAQEALAEILTLMMKWIHYSEEPVTVFGSGVQISAEMTDAGTEYVIDPATFMPEDIDISVEMTPDLPVDKLQKINGANLAVSALGYSIESALEDIGVMDAAKMMKQSTLEKLEKAIIDADIMRIQGQAQADVQGMIAEAQSKVQMAQQAQMQQEQAAQPQGMGDVMQNLPGGNTGQGFNPGMGGIPPAMGNDGQTFEGQTGMDRSGGQIAG
jgi:hypothetical protein